MSSVHVVAVLLGVIIGINLTQLVDKLVLFLPILQGYW